MVLPLICLGWKALLILPPKETFIMESENDLEMAHAETSLKLRTIGSSENYWMSSFIHLEKSPLSHRQNPPLVNAVGLICVVFSICVSGTLFIITKRLILINIVKY